MAAGVATRQDSASPSDLGIWDLAAPGGPARVATIGLSAKVQGVRFLSRTALLTIAHDGSVRLWNLHDVRHPTKAAALTTSGLLSTTIWGMGATVGTGVDADPDHGLVAVQGTDGRLHLWHVTPALKTAEVGSIPVPDPTTAWTGILGDGRTAWIATATGIDWWDISDPAHPVRGDTTRLAGANSNAFVDAGSVVADSTNPQAQYSAGNALHLFEVSAGKVRSSSSRQRSVGQALNMSEDGRLLAATDPGNNTVTLWDLREPAHPREGATVRTLQNTAGVELDRHDHLMADWSVEGGTGTVQLWDISDLAVPVLKATLQIPGLVDWMTFSPHGSRLTVATSEGFLFYDTAPSKVAEALCSHTGRSITRAQWSKYAPNTPYRTPCP
ncbi:WD40 repeat domain-containing protein [Streptomyces sp. NPDC048277]|uniref:WD40 repeat domain-containing protein n=1 Tax=Streptomyces sp. NPDC048277 TaxID=3155027 RepID=UPI0033E5B527